MRSLPRRRCRPSKRSHPSHQEAQPRSPSQRFRYPDHSEKLSKQSMRNDRNSNDNILVVGHEAHLDTTVLPRVHNFNTERFGLGYLRDVCGTLITEMSDWKKSIRDGRCIVMMIYLSELTRLPSTPHLSALAPSSPTVTAVPVRASSLWKRRGKRGG